MTTTDLSQTAWTTADAQASEALLAGLLRSPVALGLLRRTGAIVAGNPALRRMLGDDAVTGRAGLWQRIHVDDLDGASTAVASVASGEYRDAHVRARLHTPDADERWIDMHVTALDPDAGTNPLLFVCIIDVSEDMLTLAELEQRSRCDELTGLLNRRAALRALDDAIAVRKHDDHHVGLVLCDIDRFKAINDEHGHAVGDAVLRTVAERIRGHVRTGDAVARIGGDEMLVLLADIASTDQAMRIAEQLRTAVAAPMRIGGLPIHVSLSAGVVLLDDGADRDAAIARADAAMYRAKAQGRNAVIMVDAA